MRSLRVLPAALGALVLGAGAVLLLANLAVRAATPGQEIKLFPGLHGATAPVQQPFGFEAVLDGSFQRAAGQLIGGRVPLHPFAVRLRNQALYALFRETAVPSLVVGTGDQLIERAYLDEYCSRNVATFLPGARAWAGLIREMQDAAERRGQTFLYVLTPSKLAQYPDILPPGIPCSAAPLDRAGQVPAWLDTLRAAGVHVVDTVAVLSAAQSRYPFRLYPAGGAHWNQVGGMLAGQAVGAGLEELRRDGSFPLVPFAWRMSNKLDPFDTDLADLLNLLLAGAREPMPAVTPEPPPSPPGCMPRRVVIVGGSFGNALGSYLSLLPCRPVVAEYEYWHRFHETWERGRRVTRDKVDPAQRARDLQTADVVLYEENEQILGHSDHGRALHEFLLARPPGGAAGGER